MLLLLVVQLNLCLWNRQAFISKQKLTKLETSLGEQKVVAMHGDGNFILGRCEKW